MKTIDIVVPCYNEDSVLETFIIETDKVIKNIQNTSFNYILVNDGSKDNTLSIMRKLSEDNSNIFYLSFSRNFGKEAAMFAGLRHSKSDYTIVMDADLQHPPALIPQMLEGIDEGYDCVAAMRCSRHGEGKIKSFFSSAFYKINNKFSDVNLKQNAVDYRIMSRDMVESIITLSEVQRFSKGIFSWVGYDTKWIPYENVERTLGTTKWSFVSLFKYAIDGITSFSVAPLRLVSFTGFTISIIAFIYIIITLIQTFACGIAVPGYVTTLCAVLFLGGIIELSIGIIGEYIGHIYMESKDRPIYILKETNISEADKFGRKNESIN